MNTALKATISDPAPSGQVRKFSDIFPDLKSECMKIMQASKWYGLEKLEPEMVRLWIPQFSLWTRSTFKLRGLAYAHCPHPDLRLTLLDIIGEEDVIDPRVGMNHRQLFASTLANASGQSMEELADARPLPTTLVTFNILHGAANRTWEEGIALSSGLERMLQECGYFRYDAMRLQRDLGWSEGDIGWFTGHDAADVEHGSVMDKLDKYVTDDRTWDRVRDTVIECWIAWWILFDGIVDAHRYGIKPVSGLTCKTLSTVF
jgi:pyrroloquinoline quinone (PQQ) biosynthesis protein C